MLARQFLDTEETSINKTDISYCSQGAHLLVREMYINQSSTQMNTKVHFCLERNGE